MRTKRRLSAGIGALADTDLSIQDVAKRAGYRDPANFTRAFRRWTGSSPTAYREKQQPG